MELLETISTHRIPLIAAAAIMALLVNPIQAQSKAEKDAAVLKYQGKYLIAKKDGIAVGPFEKGGPWEPASGGAGNVVTEAGVIQVVPGTALVSKGEVLKITAVHLIDLHKARHGLEKRGDFDLTVENLSPHAGTR